MTDRKGTFRVTLTYDLDVDLTTKDGRDGWEAKDVETALANIRSWLADGSYDPGVDIQFSDNLITRVERVA